MRYGKDDKGRESTVNAAHQQDHVGVAELSERERSILRWRFGLKGEREHTLEEIGGKLGLTHERVRQLEARALAKLRNSENRERLEAFVFDAL